MPKSKVLFLCTGNSARSQMAEAFPRHYATDEYNAFSAGLEPKGMNPFTVKVMTEKGISLDGQYSKRQHEYLGSKQNCPTAWPGVQFRLPWQFDAPAAFQGSEEAKLAKFREACDQIDPRIQQFIAEVHEENATKAH